MNKAILVIDTPDSCSQCPLFNNFYTDMSCKGIGNRGINYPYPFDFRQDWCPLKPVPEERLVWDTEGYDFERGYNNCLHELVGESEDTE